MAHDPKAWLAWIGPLLVDHVWQATVFAAFAFAIAPLLGRARAHTRSIVWLAAAAKFAVPSFLIVLAAGSLGVGGSARLRTARAPEGASVPALETVARVAAPMRIAGESTHASAVTVLADGRLWVALAVAWGAGFAIVSGGWALRYGRFRRALAGATVLRVGREAERLAAARARLGLTRDVRLVVSPAVAQPGIRGLLRPVILLPPGMSARLRDVELEAVFLHELVHLVRWDNLTSTLLMCLCSVFWFHPAIWAIDRRLHQERERACDEAVLAHSGTPTVYAASLLKVCRFSLGARVAGVSAMAAGSDLGERLRAIAAFDARQTRTRLHPAVAAGATVLLALCLAAGLPGARAVAARIGKPVAIRFENPAGAPLVIESAAVRIASVDADGGAQDLITPPTVRLTNATDQDIVALRLQLAMPPRWNDVVPFPVAIAAHGSYVLEPDWRTWSNTVPAAPMNGLVTRIVGVTFADGRSWGEAEPAPRPVTAPEAAGSPVDAGRDMSTDGWRAAGFTNPSGAALRIVDARIAPRAAAGGPSDAGQCPYPVVRLANATDRRVVALKLRFKAEPRTHAVTAFATRIEPHGTYVFASHHRMSGDPDAMHVQVVGVQFEDGSVWGAMDSMILSTDEVVAVPEFIHAP